MTKRTISMIAVALAANLACRPSKPPLSPGIDLQGMDTSVAPGDDFNAYANGGWMKSTPIPADKASFGVFSQVGDMTRSQVRTLIQDAPNAGANASADIRKIGDFYASYMDEAAIESKGIAPLKPQLDAIAAIANRRDLARALGSRLRADVDALNSTNFFTENLFGVWITQGLTDPSRSYPYLLQGGLGMPDRDYYLSTKPEMAEMRKKYQAHIAAMLRLAGVADANAKAARLYALELKIANAHSARVDSAEVKNAVTWKREELNSKAPGLDWPVLLEAASLKDAPDFIIWHPKAIAGLSALTQSEPLDVWRDWLTFHDITQSARFLPKAFVEESFEFNGKALSGTTQLRPRWQRGVDLTSDALGETLGKVYVEKHFPPETKAKVQGMANDMVKAFGRRIDGLIWMSPETKAKAKRKLETLKVGVGYPDHWSEQKDLEIIKGDAFGNAQRAELHEYRRQIAKLNQKPDRGEWWMTPQTVNAVNLPLQNALNFPAAFLQKPYFDPAADAAYNYGSLGATIGHEISHSFDDQGAQFDADGRLSNWWTKADFEHFKAAGEALAAQYDAYRPFPDLALNGHQVLSENIADVAGLLMAFDAYRVSLNGKPDLVKDGFSGDQRFFLSYAQSWRSKSREADLRLRIATDGHAPDQYRALTVRNIDAWYDAFSVKGTQKLYLAPTQRVHVW